MKSVLISLLLAFLFAPIRSQAMEKPDSPFIVAHRGASRDAPENTLPAFHLAWEQEADAIEADFRLTEDGHIVCIHDATTKRTSEKDLVVAKASLAELQALDVGAWHSPAFKGAHIPTITEVFATIPSEKKIFVEIKSGPETVPILIRELAASGLQPEQVRVISFDADVIRELKASAPEYPANWLCSFKRKKSGEISPSLTNVVNTLERIGADGLSSNLSIPKPTLESVQAKGYPWHVWTLNQPEQAKSSLALKAQSITTDLPKVIRTELLKILSENAP